MIGQRAMRFLTLENAMKWLCGLLAMTALGLTAAGDEKAKPVALTPKEIAEGWITLFDGETTFGWKIDGEAKVKDAVLILGGEKATKAQTAVHFVTETADFEFDVQWNGTAPPTIHIPY